MQPAEQAKCLNVSVLVSAVILNNVVFTSRLHTGECNWDTGEIYLFFQTLYVPCKFLMRITLLLFLFHHRREMQWHQGVQRLEKCWNFHVCLETPEFCHYLETQGCISSEGWDYNNPKNNNLFPNFWESGGRFDKILYSICIECLLFFGQSPPFLRYGVGFPLLNQGAVSIRKTVLPGMAIPMLKIRRPNGRLIFNMEITIRR